jgi:hypothetical protein
VAKPGLMPLLYNSQSHSSDEKVNE